jgi:predicted negative regulator of RcsB-dependent stress response
MELDADSLLDTIRLKQREISLVAVVVIVIAGGTYLWRESVVRKDERAEQALGAASSSYYAGNKALAQSDLEKMVDRYSGTAAGVQGAILLSQILFESGKWDDGIKRLQGVGTSSAAHSFGPSIEALIGGALADQKRYDEAAKHYVAAAQLAPFSADKDLYKAEAARVLSLAGKNEDAKSIWAEIATRLDSPAIGEAKVRLGEMEAAAAKRP